MTKTQEISKELEFYLDLFDKGLINGNQLAKLALNTIKEAK